MSLEIKTKAGKTFGVIDTEDGNDFVIVNNKKITLSDIYQNKDLLKELNDKIIGV